MRVLIFRSGVKGVFCAGGFPSLPPTQGSHQPAFRGYLGLLGFLTLLLSTRVPFPNKISCFVSTCASSDNSFPSVRQEPSFGPWKGSLFLQQMVILVRFFFTETDILTTQGTQGASLPASGPDPAAATGTLFSLVFS